MRVPFNWLKEYIEGELELKSVADSLTMAGLEVGAVEEFYGEPVIDIELTPNRADCLSILGVAREIKALFGVELKKPVFKIENEVKDDKFKVIIADSELCYRYAGRIVRGVKIGESPSWLKKRLEQAGIRSINNIVDVTNYVLLEYGHPLHAFDLDLLKGYCIRVGTPKTISGKDREEIETLDGVKRTVSADDLLIWDAEKPVAIAGVMGGSNTEVTEKTVNVFLESAYFKPESVRKTAKRLGLSTEASYRFERGTDIENLINALDRAAYLIQQLAGGEIYEIIDEYVKKIPTAEIKFNTERIRKFLGVEIKDDEILRILSLLDIEVKQDEDSYVAIVPSHRQDLSIEEDIAEEVARIYGYENIPAALPQNFRHVEENQELSQKRKILAKIRDYMLALGFNEAVNMSFMSPEDLDIFEIPENDERRRFISLKNPLRQEESIIRTMLTPSLLKNVERNTSRGIECLKLFEISRVFIAQNISKSHKLNNSLPDEPVHLGIITKKEDFKSPFNEDPYDFYALKGVIDGLLRHFKLEDFKYQRSSEPFLHSGQSSDLYVKDERIGYIGVISPKILDKFDFKTKPYICLAEINLEKILKLTPIISQQTQITTYKPFSTYPPIKRDTAILVSLDFEAQKILEIIKKFGSELIEDAYIFDVYKGKGIPEDKKSIAFRVIYRAFDRTLTSEEVEEIHTKLIKALISETGAEQRF